jgi:hypothetical protein
VANCTRVTRVASIALLAAYALACGDSPVLVEDISPNKRLVDLSDAEFDGLCDWSQDVLASRPSEACGQDDFNMGCERPKDKACQATVAQYQACLPNLLDSLSQGGYCDLLFSIVEGRFQGIVDATPGCEGYAVCTNSYVTN